jgi:hypothetical protein
MMTISTLITTLAGLGFLGQFTILLQIPVILLKAAGYSTFRVRNDRDTVRGLLKLLNQETYSSSTVYEYGKEHPSGMFVGSKCFGYYTDGSRESENGTEIVIFTSVKNFKDIIKRSVTPCESIVLDHSEKVIVHSKPHPIKIWNRYGNYTHIYYSDFKVDLSFIYPMGDQGAIMSDIIEKYNKSKRLVSFVYGVTGAGKSTLGLLIAKEMDGAYCHDFNPTDPGDSFKNLLRDTKSDTEVSGPLVVVMEEIDNTIKMIHEGNVPRHPKAITSIHNKATFNSLLDDMIFHRNMIIIMTSNKKREEIDALDPSYIREGRVNAYYTMNEQIVA